MTKTLYAVFYGDTIAAVCFQRAGVYYTSKAVFYTLEEAQAQHEYLSQAKDGYRIGMIEVKEVKDEA